MAYITTSTVRRRLPLNGRRAVTTLLLERTVALAPPGLQPLAAPVEARRGSARALETDPVPS
jgi:hypothetical protein